LKAKLSWLFLILTVESIAVLLVASACFLNIQSTVTLCLFNILFGSITSQLNGSAIRKVVLLAAGNFIGFFWNLVFLYFFSAGIQVLGGSFDAAYTIIYPLLNLMWVVPFWAVSLGFLPNAHKTAVKTDVPI
jgi:hypothetical protein